MTLTAYLLVCLGFATLTLVSRRRPHLSTTLGLIGLLAATVTAYLLDPAEQVAIGQAGLAGSPYVRLFLLLGSLVGLGLAITGLATGTRRDAPMVTLATLGVASLTLSLTDPRTAVVAATAGGMFGVFLTLAPGEDRTGATLGIRELRAVVVGGAMGIAATAWIGRDLTQLAAQPVVFGLVYLAFALAVAVRFGAIPFHLWAARLTDAAPETSLPIITVLAPATLALVALAWNQAAIAPLFVDLEAERMVVVGIAILSIVFAAMAALVHDDLEHVVGYSIIGDAGVVLLGLAVLDPAGWGPARVWILAFVVTRSAFAAWAGGVRAVFQSGRIHDLRGWVTRSPLLTVAFGLVVLAAIGLPGLLAFEARASVASLAVEGPAGTLAFLATFAPLAYYARLLAVGVGRPARPEPATDWRPRVGRLDLTSPLGWVRTTWDINRTFSAAAIALLLAVLAVATSVGAFGSADAAAAAPPTLTGASTPSGPVSGEPSFQPVPTIR